MRQYSFIMLVWALVVRVVFTTHLPPPERSAQSAAGRTLLVAAPAVEDLAGLLGGEVLAAASSPALATLPVLLSVMLLGGPVLAGVVLPGAAMLPGAMLPGAAAPALGAASLGAASLTKKAVKDFLVHFTMRGVVRHSEQLFGDYARHFCRVGWHTLCGNLAVNHIVPRLPRLRQCLPHLLVDHTLYIDRRFCF